MGRKPLSLTAEAASFECALALIPRGRKLSMTMKGRVVISGPFSK
jgi:hypothetical protein